MKNPPPLLIDRRLLGLPGSPGSTEPAIDGTLARACAGLNRADRPLVLLAERPDRWTPTRARVDRALESQSRVERELHRAGGVLDAVLYLELGWLSRRKKRQAALEDLAERYGCSKEALTAIVRPGSLAEALKQTIGTVHTVERVSDVPSKIIEVA